MIYVCLLRGINVGGNKRIKMADLRDLLDGIGLEKVQTVLQSGNVVFETDQTDRDNLAEKIESAIHEKYGFEVTIMLRTASEWQSIIDKKPEYDIEVAGNRLALVCLQSVPLPENKIALMEAHDGDEIIHFLDKEMFIYYVNGMGKSKLSNAILERKLKIATTARNWNTVLKLQALIESS